MFDNTCNLNKIKYLIKKSLYGKRVYYVSFDPRNLALFLGS